MTRARSSGLQSQEAFARNFGGPRAPGLIVPEAFVRGIRHLGYRSNLEALAELLDNAIQAYAEQIELIFGFEGCSKSKPTSIAVIDDGHGMTPSMMRYALMWGGTHREDDRSGLGRFGYGLPCAAVSMGRRFVIYSKTQSGTLHSLSLDIDLLEKGLYVDDTGETSVPAARPDSLPPFLEEAIASRFPRGWRTGTIVLIEKLDRLDWTTGAGLVRNAVRHFGVVYHKLLRDLVMRVGGERVSPIDPLFLSDDGLLHALDDDRAQALDPITFWATDDVSGNAGQVTLRYAWLPPSFAAIDKSRDAIGINANERFAIMKRYHGIVFSRNGRLIDVLSRTPWTTFINNDRYIRVEVEFSASLDEAFGVTTSKQQVTVSQAIWDQMRMAGMPKAIEHLRMKVRTAKAERHACDRSEHKQLTNDDCKILLPLPHQSGAGFDAELDEVLEQARTLLPHVGQGIALHLLLQTVRRRLISASGPVNNEYRRLLGTWALELQKHREAPR